MIWTATHPSHLCPGSENRGSFYFYVQCGCSVCDSWYLHCSSLVSGCCHCSRVSSFRHCYRRRRELSIILSMQLSSEMMPMMFWTIFHSAPTSAVSAPASFAFSHSSASNCLCHLRFDSFSRASCYHFLSSPSAWCYCCET